MADKTKSGQRAQDAAQRRPSYAVWSRKFLSALAESSNVSAAARKAGVCTSTVYETRRDRPEFFRKWQVALCEGYDNLEMDLLQRLRSGEIKPPAGAKRSVRSFDNATAFRLLSAHRESAARERAVRDNQDAGAILVSINAKLVRMRERSQAAGEWSDDGEE
jgi:hypothetical protein